MAIDNLEKTLARDSDTLVHFGSSLQFLKDALGQFSSFSFFGDAAARKRQRSQYSAMLKEFDVIFSPNEDEMAKKVVRYIYGLERDKVIDDAFKDKVFCGEQGRKEYQDCKNEIEKKNYLKTHKINYKALLDHIAEHSRKSEVSQFYFMIAKGVQSIKEQEEIDVDVELGLDD